MYSKTQKARRSAAGDDPRLDPALGQRHDLAGLDLAQVAGADQVKRARLAGDAVGGGAAAGSSITPSASGRRPCGSRNATTRVLGHHHGRERAPQPRQHVGDRVLDPLGRVRGEQRGDDLRVRGRAERHVAAAQLGVQLDGVDQVAVVGQRQRAAVVADDRLGVLPLRGAGRRVAHVADRHVADQRAQHVLVEHLRDEALVADRHDRAAARGGRDPGRLLAAVLEREQGEVREPGDVVLGRVDAEDAALVARAVAMVDRAVSHPRARQDPRLAAASRRTPASPRSRAVARARKLRASARPRARARRHRRAPMIGSRPALRRSGDDERAAGRLAEQVQPSGSAPWRRSRRRCSTRRARPRTRPRRCRGRCAWRPG